MSTITLNEIWAWWPLITTLGGFGMAFLLWRFRGEFATKADLAALASNSAETGRRIERIESEMQHLPSKGDIHKIQLGMSEINGKLGEIRAESRGDRDLLTRVEAALTRHEDILATNSRNGGRT